MKDYAILFQGRDLDYKIQEYKEAGKIFPENQIIEWFIQLLLGVDYMHERYVCWFLRTGYIFSSHV
jgi:serine/threonine protein kinase